MAKPIEIHNQIPIVYKWQRLAVLKHITKILSLSQVDKKLCRILRTTSLMCFLVSHQATLWTAQACRQEGLLASWIMISYYAKQLDADTFKHISLTSSIQNWFSKIQDLHEQKGKTGIKRNVSFKHFKSLDWQVLYLLRKLNKCQTETSSCSVFNKYDYLLGSNF